MATAATVLVCNPRDTGPPLIEGKRALPLVHEVGCLPAVESFIRKNINNYSEDYL